MPCSKRKNGITLTESFKRADEWLIKRKSKKRKRNTRTKAGGKKQKRIRIHKYFDKLAEQYETVFKARCSNEIRERVRNP